MGHAVHSQEALAALLKRRPELADCRASIETALELLAAAFAGGHKLLLCGNGGSAADCEHWSGELLNKFKFKRPLPPEVHGQLEPHLAAALQGGLPAIPLTSLSASATSIANDCDEPHVIFAQLVCSLGKPGDVLVGLSTSGNAKNVVNAFKIARAMGLKTLALTGRGGGALAPLSDAAIQVPSDHTFEIQELHLPVYHYLCEALEARFFA